MNELERDLTVNPDKLDVEWMLLPSLYFKYREEADYVDTLLSKKKMELDIAIAELDRKIRATPKSILGIDKPTENSIRSCIDCDIEINGIKTEYIDLTKRRKLLASAISALEMKRDSLKNLVSLYNGEYFSSKPVNGIGDINAGDRRNIRREIKARIAGENNEKE